MKNKSYNCICFIYRLHIYGFTWNFLSVYWQKKMRNYQISAWHYRENWHTLPTTVMHSSRRHIFVQMYNQPAYSSWLMETNTKRPTGDLVFASVGRRGQRWRSTVCVWVSEHDKTGEGEQERFAFFKMYACLRVLPLYMWVFSTFPQSKNTYVRLIGYSKSPIETPAVSMGLFLAKQMLCKKK